MLKRLVHISFLYILCFGQNGFGQQFNIVNETEAYADYEFVNQELRVYPPYSINAPFENGQAQYKVLEQSFGTKKIQSKDSETDLEPPFSGRKNLIEVINPGEYRGRSIASLKINLTRYSDESATIVRRLRIRISKSSLPATGKPTSLTQRKLAGEDHPLSSGEWFKIPVTERGIFELDADYLEALGLITAEINPRNLQLWGTDGYVLPEANSASRPEFSELPVRVEGESDGSFDADDRIIFFGNTPDQVFRNESNQFEHEIHPYSDTTFVFLTVGSSPGRRLTTANNGLTPVSTITEFDDFIWKEDELYKAEDKLKSGRYWFGQRISGSAQNQDISVFETTIPGLNTNIPLQIAFKVAARAEESASFSFNVNETPLRTFSVSRIYEYNSSSGYAAQEREFPYLSFNPPIGDDNRLQFTLNMFGTDESATGFLDYIRIVARRSLIAQNNKLFFMPPLGGTASDMAEYVMSGFSEEPLALDVTDPMNPALLSVSGSGSDYRLIWNRNPDSKILVQSDLTTPEPGRAVPNQNLHAITNNPDYIIITSEILLDYAQELADYRQTNDGLTPVVVTQKQVLNEFSAGSVDPTANRDFIKYLWDLAVNNGNEPPRYVLLFGDTSYDTKNIISGGATNHVLTYESQNSIHRTDSYGSDDYYSFMGLNEGRMESESGTFIAHRPDLGVGRISSQTRSEAATALEKIYSYENPVNDGEWQNLFTFAGDDDFPKTSEKDLHVLNADSTAEVIDVNNAGIRLKKIYLFSYLEEITGVGRQFPEATQDLINTINKGTLVTNYSGHGNNQVLTDEDFFTSDHIPELTNSDKLTLLVTATCQFGRYDDSDAQSGAEKMVFAPNGGAIASFTTTRVVFTSSNPASYNFGLNIQLSRQMLERDANGRPQRLGDIFEQTKNTAVGISKNSRRFILIGDPAIRIRIPDNDAQLDEINGISIAENPDTVFTIKALDQVNISGSVADRQGNVLPGFNGEVNITVYDARRPVNLPQNRTWSDDCLISNCDYLVENDVLFKGKAAVENGQFTIGFIIPKDISFSPTSGRVVLFAKNSETTAGGSFTNLKFNGVNPNAVNDGQGPALDVFLNDESFINGSLSTDSPNLIVELRDSSGINTTGTGVGHEIIATIDTKPQQTYVLNEFYEGTLNDFTRGRIEYPLDDIPEGSYALKVRAWDVHNNPSEKEIFFEVASEDVLVIDQVYNYPNPMNNNTSFTFEHNQQGNPLEVDIRIYTLSGKPVQHLKEYITNTSSSYASISWNGRDRDYDRLGNGTYIYVLRVTTDTPEGRESTEKIEKLVIIR